MNDRPRVVITGMGAVSPYGVGVDILWQNIIAGKSGIVPITIMDTEGYPSKIAGEVRNFEPTDYLDKKDTKRMDRFTQFAMIAALEAWKDAGLDIAQEDATRIGVVVGSAAGGIGTIEAQHSVIERRGPAKCSPFTVPMMIIDMSAGRIAIMLGAKGPNKAVVTACATSANSVGDACRMIQYGEVDIAIAGGSESPITPLSMAAFAAAKTLSLRNDEPEKASRPFDKDRDGFVMAEGGGIFVLEELEHAKKRGAKIYAEIVGYGSSSDAYDIVSPCPDGDGAVRSMNLAIKDAGLTPDDVDYINAHGTSTSLGDVAETLAIKTLFKDHARNGLMVSSTKSMTGHTLGAAGVIESVISVKSIIHKIAPPTINLDTPDDQCDLDYVPNTARKAKKLDVALSNSFGFGGHNASLLYKEYIA